MASPVANHKEVTENGGIENGGIENANITVTSTTTFGSLTPEETETRSRNIMQSVEFSPTLTKASFRHSRRCSDTSDDGMQIKNISKSMLTLYLQHLGNAIYLMFIMALGFVYPLTNALSYGGREYEKTKEQFEIFMIIVHGISIVVLTIIVVRLTLRKSDEDRGHGEGLNFFLRIGAIVFCIGVIILNILRALEPVELLLMFDCKVTVKPTHITFYALSVIFYALQTYFMFKYHKTSFLSGPNKQEGTNYVLDFWFIRLTLMHQIALNLIHWLTVIMWEALEIFETAQDNYANITSAHGGIHRTSQKEDNSHGHDDDDCAHKRVTWKRLQPYLFPCVIEYSLIAASNILFMYMRLTLCEKERLNIHDMYAFSFPFASIRRSKHSSECMLSHGGTHVTFISSRCQSSAIIDRKSNEEVECESENGFAQIHLGEADYRLSVSCLTKSSTVYRQNSTIVSQPKLQTRLAVKGRLYLQYAKSACLRCYVRPCQRRYIRVYICVIYMFVWLCFIVVMYILHNAHDIIDQYHDVFKIVWMLHDCYGIVLVAFLIYRMTFSFTFDHHVSHSFDKMLLYINSLSNYIFLFLCITAEIHSVADGWYCADKLCVLYIFEQIVVFIQQTMQTLFLLYAVNMRAMNDTQRRLKTGRTAISLCLCLNLVLWLRDSLLLKYHALNDRYVHYYGLLPWCLIISMCYPSIIFIRFHSTALLAEVYTTAYY